MNSNSGGSPAVYAYNDSFGATALQPEISSALSGDVFASQAGGLLALPPSTANVQCPGDVPVGVRFRSPHSGRRMVLPSATAAT